MQQHLPSLAVAGLLVLAPALSPAEDLEGRVNRIENILDSQRASDLTLQVQAMEREMQRLRGLVEQQQFELDRLRRQTAQGPAAEGKAPPAGPGVAAAAGQKQPEPAEAPATAATPAGQQPGGSRAGVESSVPPLTAVAAPESPASPSPQEMPKPQEAGADQGATAEAAEPPAAKPAKGEQEAYIKAVEPLKQRRFEEAAVSLTDFLSRYPNSANADKAHFWLAETHYVNRNVTAALKEFQTVLKDYPKSSKVPGALLKIGYIQDDAKDPRAARATLQELIRRFPQSGEARLAQARLDQMTQEGR